MFFFVQGQSALSECDESVLVELRIAIKEKRTFYFIMSPNGERHSSPGDKKASLLHTHLESQNITPEVLFMDRNQPSLGFSALLEIQEKTAICINFLVEKESSCDNVENIRKSANTKWVQGALAFKTLLEVGR